MTSFWLSLSPLWVEASSESVVPELRADTCSTYTLISLFQFCSLPHPTPLIATCLHFSRCAASHLFGWNVDGLPGWCVGTDLGQLSMSHCFNRSSFNHLASFHSEIFNSVNMDFAVRKMKSSWAWQSGSLILPDLIGKAERRTVSTVCLSELPIH